MSQISHFFKHNFSLKTSLVAICLSVIMLTAARWQWRRYYEKLELVKTYSNHQKSSPIQFDPSSYDSLDLAPYLSKKVLLRGHFDFNKSVIVTNRRHKLGTGHWLLSPYILENSKKIVMISRGFIPYEDREKSLWEKYKKESPYIIGVVSKSVGKRSSLSPSAKMPFSDIFLYPDLELIKDSVNLDIDSDYYLQAISEPVFGQFPATDISIDVPPSTHFWYTFEWIGLAFLTLLISFLLQLFRPRKKSV